jgi:hypothetical protein
MILKLAFLSCAFYLGLAILLELTLQVAAKINGSVGFAASPSIWFLLFGLMWLGSFSLTWHIVSTQIRRMFHS